MRAVIQRVTQASVSIEGEVYSSVEQGFLVLLGACEGDDEHDCELLCSKIAAMRIFSDEQGKMNRSLDDVSGQVLVVSQFTLYADCRKGNRPSFARSGDPAAAKDLYERFVALMRRSLGEDRVKTGVFAADMAVSLVNDGPVTIVLDSQELRKPRRG